MLVVAFDTSTFQLAAGWFDTEAAAGRAHGTLSCPAVPGHAETLLGHLGSLLSAGGRTLEEADLIVFGKGPGTFTGLRIGLSTAKGIALSGGTPLVGVPTLEAMALSAPVRGSVMVLVDARRGEIYAGAFEVGDEGGTPTAWELVTQRVARPGEVAAIAEEAGVGSFHLQGSGALRYADELAALAPVLPERYATPDPYVLGRRGLEIFRDRGPDDPATVEPSYLREPDAKLPDRPLK